MMPPPLHSERLVLRLITLEDLKDIHALHSLPETDEFNTLGIPESKQVTERVITPWIACHKAQEIQQYTFAIRTANGSFIGLIALQLGAPKYKKAEIWYKLHSSHWNQGFGTEALRTLLKFGFNTLQLHRIEAGCAVENIASIRLLEKVGMTREGRKRAVLPLKSGWSDNYMYGLLDTDYELSEH